MHNKSILHVVNIYFVLPYFIGDQFKYLKDKGFDLHVICSESEHLKGYSQQQSFKYLEVPILRAFSLSQDIKSLVQICKYIKRNKIDTVVGHTPKGALLAMIAAFIMKVPNRIYFRHGLMYETSKGFKRILLINMERLTSFCAKKIVCVSPSVAKISVIDKLNTINKQIVIGKGTCGGIDAILKFNPQKVNPIKFKSLQSQYNITSNDFVIGYCGRLVKDKGIIELVEAFNLLSTNKNFKLLLVGDFEERDALPQRTIDVISGNPNIIKTGFVFNDIEYYYQLMTIFILPSFREGFPISVLEASAMQLPILTTKVTGCVDSIIDGVTGYYIENTAQSIYENVIEMCESSNFEKIGCCARDFVLNNFDNSVLWPLLENELYKTNKQK